MVKKDTEIIKKEDKLEVIKIDGKKHSKQKFFLEEFHPAVGRILIFDDVKFRILDDRVDPIHRTGTFIKKLTEEDEEAMEEYDEDIEKLSEKLVDRIDIKRMIKEQINQKPSQEIKTGLFILKELENGKKVEEEHHKGCYSYKAHLGNQVFQLETAHSAPGDVGI